MERGEKMEWVYCEGERVGWKCLKCLTSCVFKKKYIYFLPRNMLVWFRIAAQDQCVPLSLPLFTYSVSLTIALFHLVSEPAFSAAFLLLSVYLPAQNTSLSWHKDSTESLNRHLLPLCVCVPGEEIKTSHPSRSSLLSVSVGAGVFLVTLWLILNTGNTGWFGSGYTWKDAAKHRLKKCRWGSGSNGIYRTGTIHHSDRLTSVYISRHL